MKFKRIICIVLLSMILMSGCGTKSKLDKHVSFSPKVCSFEVQASCWTILDCIPSYVDVMADNTIKVYCGNLTDTDVTMDYIYGETFDITEDQKNELITVIKNNAIGKDEDLDGDACDGSYLFLTLYDSDGAIVQCNGGLQPYDDRFETIEDAILALLPDNALSNVHKTSEDIVKNYLIENYPDRYQFLLEN